jgi:hypothetical protein
VRPYRVLALDITAAERPEWTGDERTKLIQLQEQGNLFDATDAKSIATLRKLPFDFHYRYSCIQAEGVVEYRHKIVDWEAGALYWNVRSSQGENWEAGFRVKLERELPTKDLMFLMGTMHRFPDLWLIVSLIYPPKPPPEQQNQPLLL